MDEPPSSNLLADRRWLIGIGVSLAFGIFGAVMAFLNYAARTKSPAQLAAPTVTAGTTPLPPPTTNSRGKGRRHE